MERKLMKIMNEKINWDIVLVKKINNSKDSRTMKKNNADLSS